MNKILNFVSVLKEKVQLTETIYRLKYQVPVGFVYTPGQFVGARVLPTHTRAYSIVGLKDNLLELLIDIKPSGRASKYFAETQVGHEVQILGPYGIYGIKSDLPNKVFISTGTGISPFIPMIKSLDINKVNINCLFGVRFDSHDIAYSYFENMLGSNFKYYQCVTREDPVKPYSIKGRVTDVLPQLILDGKINVEDTEFYICGANEMIADVVDELKSKGADKIYFEKYG